MATRTQRTNHRVTSIWTDVITSIPGAANAAGILRNLSGEQVDVIKGGTAPAANDSAIAMLPHGQEFCEADHIWVRTTGRFPAIVAFEALS